MSYDLVIRGGTVVDGSGLASYRADVGVKDGRIARIGRIHERGRQEVDAGGQVVTPGFIDGHTHMDAQIHWDPLGTSSCWHGITTVVMGNCGFTLAPRVPGREDLMVRSLERAEDISPAAMAAGIKFEWETFPEYLDVLDRLPKGINYAANIGHSALRTWAMGEKAFESEANEDELQRMQAQLEDALRAGAIGFTTSRSFNHATSDDRPVASRLASWSEVQRLVGAMGKLGVGVFELAAEAANRSADTAKRREYLGRLKALAVDTGVPVTFGIIPVANDTVECWEDHLALLDQTAAAGGRMFAQTHSRELSIFLSFKSQLPFDKLPEWRELRAKPLAEQARLLRDPELRRRLVESANKGDYGLRVGNEPRAPKWDLIRVFDSVFPPFPSIADIARERGKDPLDTMIDLALEKDLDRFFIQYSNQAPTDEHTLRAMRHPRAVMTFSDTGAHVSQIADASIQTHLLSHWVRNRKAFTLEEAVRMITLAPAQAWGFSDRGLLSEGLVADINVFDPTRIAPRMPEVVHDLPTGAQRLIQYCDGIKATVVAGEILMLDGKHTGALPGRLLRGPLAQA